MNNPMEIILKDNPTVATTTAKYTWYLTLNIVKQNVLRHNESYDLASKYKMIKIPLEWKH